MCIRDSDSLAQQKVLSRSIGEKMKAGAREEAEQLKAEVQALKELSLIHIYTSEESNDKSEEFFCSSLENKKYPQRKAFLWG